MKILISAAETSSDAHGAELLKALTVIRTRAREAELSASPMGSSPIEAFGIGGPKLRAAGLRVVVDARELLSMGFSEILGRLPRIFRAMSQISQEAARVRPDVAVVIDYPDFHFRLARRLKKLGIPVIYYIPPKVWAWRKGRVKTLRELFARVLSILPFEETFYNELNIPVKYVGNPLVDELPFSLSREDARRKLGLGSRDRVLVLMPGSRKFELKGHLNLMIQAAAAAATKLRTLSFLAGNERLVVLMPFPETIDLDKADVLNQIKKAEVNSVLDIRVSQGNAAECLVAADAGIIKSGTSTLEAGLLKCPHTIIYKPSRTTAWIYKYLIRYKGPVGLVNLVADWRSDGKYPADYLVREILCEKVTPDAVTQEIIELMSMPEKREKMIQGFIRVREKVCGKTLQLSPSMNAAREVIQVLEENKLIRLGQVASDGARSLA